MDAGERIKFIRKQKGMSQNELARKADISQSGLSYIESGGKKPNTNTLQAIARALKVSLYELLGETDPLISFASFPDDKTRSVLDKLRNLPDIDDEVFEIPSTIPKFPEIDDEAQGILDMLHNRPEIKTLLETSKNVKKEDVENVTNIMKALGSQKDRKN